jgi:hypothetical protein
MKTRPTFRGEQHKVTFFFMEPSVGPGAHNLDGHFSVLYLLRRELLETMGYDPNTDPENLAWKEGARNRLFASLALMFTGFDLLAKFEQGDRAKVGPRFKAFLGSPSGADIHGDDAKIFWAVRNSIVHAFNTPDAKNLAQLKMRSIALAQRRVQQMTIGPGYSFVVRDHETATVYIDGVYQVFVDSVKNYYDSLHDRREYPRAWGKFQAMFDKYGTIQIQTRQ